HALLMQLAALHKLELSPLKAIGYYRRALRLRPDDGYAAGQLRSLVGDEADALLPPAHLTLQTQPGRPPTGASSQAGSVGAPRPKTSTSTRTVPVQPIPA